MSAPSIPSRMVFLRRHAWLAAGLTLSLAACGGGDKPAAPAQPTTTPTPAAPATPAPTPETAQTPAPAPEPPKSVDELLKLAQKAVSENRIVAPDGNNALEYYGNVLLQEPNNIKAQNALADVLPLVTSAAERELNTKNVNEAARLVVLLDRAYPKSYTVNSIRNRLDALRNNLQKEEDAKKLAEQQKAQQAAAAAAAAQQAAAAPTPAPTTTPARPATPTPPPVAEAPAPKPTPVEPPRPTGETREARIVRKVQPAIPQEALRKHESGWVEVEFVVGTDGKVKSANVLRAQPARTFDREALKAVQQWMFDPALRDGQPVETRLQQRLEFQLQ